MCGICGIVSPAKAGPEAREPRLRAMLEALHHRGPDASGTWHSADGHAAFGHARLSIIDLSPAGHQPMSTECGRYTLCFNGEIYNYPALRRRLLDEGASFRGHSDTEVLLYALARWGLQQSLARIEGMFAFALWDRETRTLHLARDRAGEKPLYVGRCGDSLVFASELHALRRLPEFATELDQQALALFLKYNFIPAPHSIYRDARKLPAASHLSLDLSAPALPSLDDLLSGSSRRYWSACEVAREADAERRDPPAEADIDALHQRLRESVRGCMLSDVPLGAFLSGGVDSTAVVALMQSISATPVKTFTIGFDAGDKDESRHAAAVAKTLGTDHRELIVTGRDALQTLPTMVEVFDEPFADSSAIPTYLVARLAREDVKVALTGDGGDELLYGYRRNDRAERLLRLQQHLPGLLRRAARRGAGRLGRIAAEGKLHRLLHDLAEDRPGRVYANRLTRWYAVHRLMPGLAREPAFPLAGLSGLDDLQPRQALMLLDFLGYLPEDILTKTDRTSMALGLAASIAAAGATSGR